MSERLNNDFQFVQVGRVDPAKKPMVARTHDYVEIYEPFTPSLIWSLNIETLGSLEIFI